MPLLIDMNLDKLGRFPIQNDDHRPYECTAETIADIVANITGIPMDPGYGYGATFHLASKAPEDAGLDPFTAFQAQCVYGSLPTANEDFDAVTTSELYEANFDNYALDDKQLAQKFAQKGVIPLRGYDNIVSYMARTGWPVGLAVKWYSTFAGTNQDNTLPSPLGPFTSHMVEVCEETSLGLRLKDWQHPFYTFMSRNTLGLVFEEAYGFDPNAKRWFTLAGAALGHWPRIPEILPLMKASARMPS